MTSTEDRLERRKANARLPETEEGIRGRPDFSTTISISGNSDPLPRSPAPDIKSGAGEETADFGTSRRFSQPLLRKSLIGSFIYARVCVCVFSIGA
jgi:hypothetical protein